MVELETLRSAHKTAAKIVVEFGDVYLPIFERIHNELQATEANYNLKSLAILISNKDNAV